MSLEKAFSLDKISPSLTFSQFMRILTKAWVAQEFGISCNKENVTKLKIL